MRILRKAHCSPPLVGEDNSMVFTSHLVPFPGHSWLEMAPRERQKPFHFLNTSDGKQVLTLNFHNFTAIKKTVPKLRNEYLFTVTGVKKIKWFLSLTRCHFEPRVTEGHEWLEMAPSEK